MPRKQVIVHAGLPKTGTTSIQNLLAAEHERLERSGRLFPVTNAEERILGRGMGVGKGWHQGLSNSLLGRFQVLSEGERQRWEQAFERFRDSRTLHQLLLSSETIGTQAHKMDFQWLLDRLPECDITIVVVLRDAEAWLTSLYEQSVRSKNRTSRLPSDFRPAAEYAEGGYAAKLDSITRVLPAARIKLLSFEMLVKEGLLKGFARELALPKKIQSIAESAASSNPSMPQHQVAFLRAANAAGISDSDFLSIRKGLAKSAKKKQMKVERVSIFPKPLSKKIQDRYAEDRIHVESKFGLTLPEPRLMPQGNPAMTMSAEQVDELRKALSERLTDKQMSAFEAAAVAAVESA